MTGAHAAACPTAVDVYESDTESEEDLVARVFSGEAEIRETPGIFGRVRQSMARQWTALVVVGQKAGSILTVQHCSFLERSSFCLCLSVKYLD